jgi:hypothetical protein
VGEDLEEHEGGEEAVGVGRDRTASETHTGLNDGEGEDGELGDVASGRDKSVSERGVDEEGKGGSWRRRGDDARNDGRGGVDGREE